MNSNESVGRVVQMNLITKDYIEIKWLQRQLIEMIYNGEARDQNLQIFLRLIEKWRRENENSDGSSL